ncbi:hypothetical protein B4Q13_20130, partial [Lacticaseibacillus rhamnosus]
VSPRHDVLAGEPHRLQVRVHDAVPRGGVERRRPTVAGADPGPVCYDRGGDNITVTDANMVAGVLDPDHFLGGRMKGLAVANSASEVP